MVLKQQKTSISNLQQVGFGGFDHKFLQTSHKEEGHRGVINCHSIFPVTINPEAPTKILELSDYNLDHVEQRIVQRQLQKYQWLNPAPFSNHWLRGT